MTDMTPDELRKMVAAATKIRRRFDSWQTALDDSDQTVRDCNMKRALFYAEAVETYKSGLPIFPDPTIALALADSLAREAAMKAEIERLRGASQALGVMPGGYCFCSKNRIGDDSKKHEPECADLRALLMEASSAG